MSRSNPFATKGWIKHKAPGVLMLGVAMVVASLVPQSVLSLQDRGEAETYSAQLLDWQITISGPNYVLADVALEDYPHGRGERVSINSAENLGFVEIAFFDDGDAPEDTIDLALRDFDPASRSLEVLDSGVVEGVHFALAWFERDQGHDGYFYFEVREDVVGNVDFSQSIYALTPEFVDQMEIAQQQILVNGVAFLDKPVIDVGNVIIDHQALLASTPEVVPTPARGTYTFQALDVNLVVDAPIEFNFPLRNNQLDLIYLVSPHGYGVVGFIHQQADSPEDVISSVFVDAPVGAEAPVELHLEYDDSHALGVYRISFPEETRVMVILVEKKSDDMWTVEAMAVTKDEFAAELAGFQQGVTFAGERFLGDIDEEVILTIFEND